MRDAPPLARLHSGSYDRQRARMADRVRLAGPTTSHKTSSETTRPLAKRPRTMELPAGGFDDARVFRSACFFLAETVTK